MKLILSTIIIFLIILIQASLCPHLKIYGVFPNLILILVLILSILRGHKKSLTWIIVGGLFLDIFSFNNPLGISVLGLFLVGHLANFFSHNIFKKNSVFSVILIGIGGTLIYKLFLLLILLIVGINFQFTFLQLISQIIYNLVILIPLFYLIRKCLKRNLINIV